MGMDFSGFYSLFAITERGVSMNQNYMKEKPVLSLVLSMSLPMVISMLVNALYNIVDSFYVAKISENAMTAVSLVYPIQNLISALAIGFGIGVNVVISIALGAGKKEKADQALCQGLLLSLVHGFVCMFICSFIMPKFLGMFTSDKEIMEYALEYANVVFMFSVSFSLAMVCEKVFQAVGRMKTSMIALLSGCILNIVLDPMMIFGFGPIPAMGIKGAALATGLGQTLQFVIYAVVYLFNDIGLHMKRNLFFKSGNCVKEMYGTGIPATLNLALPSVLITALNGILATVSEQGILILGIYYKLQTFLYLTTNGFVQGMRPLVGYNYGAKEYKRVKKIIMDVLLLSSVVMVIGTLICVVNPQSLMGLYTTNQKTIELGSVALRIISAGFIISGISCTITGALEGLGKGLPSLMISLLRYIIIMIPSAFILAKIMGVNGVWMAFPVTEVISAILSFVIYKRFARM